MQSKMMTIHRLRLVQGQQPVARRGALSGQNFGALNLRPRQRITSGQPRVTIGVMSIELDKDYGDHPSFSAEDYFPKSGVQ